MKKLKTAVNKFLDRKQKVEDNNTAYLYELTMEEIMAIAGDIELMDLNHITYLKVVSTIKRNSLGDSEIFAVNMSILNEFMQWSYDRGYIEHDLAYTYNLWLN